MREFNIVIIFIIFIVIILSIAYTRVLKLVALQPRMNFVMYCICLPNTMKRSWHWLFKYLQQKRCLFSGHILMFFIPFCLSSHLNFLILVLKVLGFMLYRLAFVLLARFRLFEV